MCCSVSGFPFRRGRRASNICYSVSFETVRRSRISLTNRRTPPICAHIALGAFLDQCFSRRYQKGHWDAVIVNYKEVELQDETIEDSRILDIFSRVRQHVEEHHLTYQPVSWLSCHAIDYNKDGELNPHVDSVKFSGHSVSGLSLLSPAVMRLTPDDEPDTGGHVDLLLPPLSLYCLTGVGRYRYAHQLLPGECVFTGPTGVETIVSRDHRLSIIFRDAKPEELE